MRTCVDALPTTVLTNGMVFRGRGRRALESMPRKGLALQISLDSATADLHDAHRGAGSWQKAVDGIRLALSLGFRVRVAATVAAPAPGQLDDFHRFLDELGIAADDQVIRRSPRRGSRPEGAPVRPATRSSRRSSSAADAECWLHAEGIDKNPLVSQRIEPFAPALDEIARLFAEQWAKASTAAALFPCA